jgi:hypothetical protein
MGANHGRLYVLITEQSLNSSNIEGLFKQVCSNGVARGMARGALLRVRLSYGILHGTLDGRCVNMVAALLAGLRFLPPLVSRKKVPLAQLRGGARVPPDKSREAPDVLGSCEHPSWCPVSWDLVVRSWENSKNYIMIQGTQPKVQGERGKGWNKAGKDAAEIGRRGDAERPHKGREGVGGIALTTRDSRLAGEATAGHRVCIKRPRPAVAGAERRQGFPFTRGAGRTRVLPPHR